jgi:predicted DCC family thiol-disulfide oxidoreductase YuxK
MCWLTIVTELGLAAALPFQRMWPFAVWVSLLFHASLLEFTGTTFTMFFYAMEAAMLAFVAWPREMVVIYDGDCGICNKIRRAMERVDFERAFRWETSQSGAGDRWGIARQALNEKLHFVVDGRVTRGFHACKLILLYNPALYVVLALAIAAVPEGWSWYRRIVVGAVLAFFFPLFNPVGEWAYSVVARNRHRIGAGTCAVEPR